MPSKTASLPRESTNRKPTLKTIASACGVSAMTVSNILNANPERKYKETTKKRIFEVAEELGYHQNRAAQAFRTGRSGVFGFVADSFSHDRKTVANYVVHAVLTGMSGYLTNSGRHVSIVPLSELKSWSKGDLPTVLQENFLDGLVIHIGVSERIAETILKSGIPCVFYDSGIFFPHNCIYRDEEAAMAACVERLHALGHRRIAYGPSRALHLRFEDKSQQHYSVKVRYDAYLKEIKLRGLEPILVEMNGIEQVDASVRQQKPTAIISESDYGPMLGALYAQGCRVGKDISLVQIATETSFSRRDMISGMSYDRLLAGELAGRMIVEMVRTPEAKVPTIVLPMEWTDYETVGPPPEKKSK